MFVDCDDTLVIYESGGKHPFGDYCGEPWKPHEALVEAINAWEGDVFIWSGGGRDYARMWGERLIEADHVALGKDQHSMALVRECDIAVDDEKIQVAGRVLTADEFVAAPTEEANG